MKESGTCGLPGKPACSSFCECEIKQESGAELTACQRGGTPATPGYCYIDDPKAAAVVHCDPNQRRALHFVDSPTNRIPANNAVAFIACEGAAINPDP